MATYILKRLFRKLFAGIGRSGYPRYYTPNELSNDENLPVIYDVAPLGVFVDDMQVLPKRLSDRVIDLIESLKNGYIYENNPNDPDEYTHSRPRANAYGYYIYSKDVDNEHRFIYGIKGIHKKIINGQKTLVVNIKLIECSDHDTDEEIKERISGKMSFAKKQGLKKRVYYSEVE